MNTLPNEIIATILSYLTYEEVRLCEGYYIDDVVHKKRYGHIVLQLDDKKRRENIPYYSNGKYHMSSVEGFIPSWDMIKYDGYYYKYKKYAGTHYILEKIVDKGFTDILDRIRHYIQ